LSHDQQRQLVIRRTLRLGPGHPGTLSHQPIPIDQDTPRTQAEHVQRNLFNRLIGILYLCLQTGQAYDEQKAFQISPTAAVAAAA